MSDLQRYSTCNYSEFDYSSDGEWVKSTDAEAALAVRDKRIKELEQMNRHLQDCILKDSCPWCGLNNKTKIKREDGNE